MHCDICFSEKLTLIARTRRSRLLRISNKDVNVVQICARCSMKDGIRNHMVTVGGQERVPESQNTIILAASMALCTCFSSNL